MASVKACDAVYHVDPPPAAKKLREMLYNFFYTADHTVHFYALGGPDFVLGPTAPPAERNILGVIRKVGLEAGKQVIALRARCQELIEMIGGKKIHQVTCLPGGIQKVLTEEERKKCEDYARQNIEFGKFTFKVFADIVLANPAYVDLITGPIYRHETYSMGLVDAKGQVKRDRAGGDHVHLEPLGRAEAHDRPPAELLLDREDGGLHRPGPFVAGCPGPIVRPSLSADRHRHAPGCAVEPARADVPAPAPRFSPGPPARPAASASA